MSDGSTTTTTTTTTYTLRMPDGLKRRLERSARHRGLSVNQFVIEVITNFYQTAQTSSSTDIQLKNGRKLRIRTKMVDPQLPGSPSCWFYLDDPDREAEVACYEIGISPDLLRHFSVRPEEEQDLVKELGITLLRHHNEHGKNICQLDWKQLPTRPDFRQINRNDLKRDDGSYIISEDDFHYALAKPNLWHDRNLKEIIEPALPAELSLLLQQETEKYYDQRMSSFIQQNNEKAIAKLISEKKTALGIINDVTMGGDIRLCPETGAKVIEEVKKGIAIAAQENCRVIMESNGHQFVLTKDSNANEEYHRYLQGQTTSPFTFSIPAPWPVNSI